MWLADPSRWSGRFQYVEVGRFVPDLSKLVRERLGKSGDKDRPPRFYKVDVLEDWRRQHGNVGLYTSVLQRAGASLRSDALGNLYFDLDNKEDPEVAHRETRTLVAYLINFIPEDALRIYFTGMKGFHVEVEAVALGIGPMADLIDHYRFIAGGLRDDLSITSFDFSVYDERRMWRLPDSEHQETGLFKVHLEPGELELSLDEIKKLAAEPRWFKVCDQEFNASANQWFREWSYRREMANAKPRDHLGEFMRRGTATVRLRDDEFMFDPKGLFEGCPAVLRWWDYADKERDLPHDARLFLCSLLTYTEEAEQYLHDILSACDDYNPNKTQSHIDDWKRRRELGIGGRPFSCQKANSVGVGCGTCDLQPKQKLEAVGDRLVSTGEEAKASPVRFAYRSVKGMRYGR